MGCGVCSDACFAFTRERSHHEKPRVPGTAYFLQIQSFARMPSNRCLCCGNPIRFFSSRECPDLQLRTKVCPSRPDLKWFQVLSLKRIRSPLLSRRPLSGSPSFMGRASMTARSAPTLGLRTGSLRRFARHGWPCSGCTPANHRRLGSCRGSPAPFDQLSLSHCYLVRARIP
jgi:hypothetical protein